jgi:hypothetical protein
MNPRPCAICAHPATRKCGGCKTVHYCSQEHQRQGWPKHKGLCKIYQMENPPDPSTYCGLCGKSERLTRTECCDRPICDDQRLYQLMTYSRVSCHRNHERYTVCHSHRIEHPQETCHWQDCVECREFYRGIGLEIYVGQGTSNCNFAEDRWDDPPPFEPTCCSRCGGGIKVNCDGYSVGRNGRFCTSCSAQEFGSSPQPGQVLHRFN